MLNNLCIYNINKHNKSGTLVVFPHFVNNKKAGLHCCCSASQGSRIAYYSEQATPKPTPICTTEYTNIWYIGCIYTYPEDIKMLQCLGTMLELARF